MQCLVVRYKAEHSKVPGRYGISHDGCTYLGRQTSCIKNSLLPRLNLRYFAYNRFLGLYSCQTVNQSQWIQTLEIFQIPTSTVFFYLITQGVCILHATGEIITRYLIYIEKTSQSIEVALQRMNTRQWTGVGYAAFIHCL